MAANQRIYKTLKSILTIHKLLRTGNEVSGEALAKACGTDKRTIVDYVALMKSSSFKAPIESSRYYGYRYKKETPFSLLGALEDTESGTLNELLAVVRQLQHTKELRGMERVLLALERQIGVINGNPNPLIEFEEAELRGREYLDKLYRLIHQQKFIRVLYQGFDMQQPVSKILYPVQLREFNNRWYLIAWGEIEGEPVLQNIPIDRIQQEPGETTSTFEVPDNVDITAYFKDLIGVTKTNVKITVKLRFHNRKRANYAITKKIHASQSDPVYNEDDTIDITFEVEWNKELIAKILEFGADVEVLEPKELRQKIAETLRSASAWYEG